MRYSLWFAFVCSTIVRNVKLSEVDGEQRKTSASGDDEGDDEDTNGSEEEVAGGKGRDTAVLESTLKYPENQPLEQLSYSILEFLEREETFAQMLKELVAKIMSIGKDAARVSTDLLILAALSDLAQRIVAHERTLTNYDAVVGKMIEINVSQLAKVVGQTGVAGEGELD